MTQLQIRPTVWLRRPLPRLAFPMVGCVVAVATVISTSPCFLAPYSTWHGVSAAWHESLVYPGSLAAGLSAGVAAILFHGTSPSRQPRNRLGVAAVLTHVAPLMGWVLLGHVLGMTVATIHAALTATWGSLRISDVLVALAGLACVVAAGFAAGVALRSMWAVPLAGGVAFALLTLSYVPVLRPLALMQPVQHWDALAKFTPNLPVTAFSLVAAVAGVVAAVTLADAALGGRRRIRAGHVVWALVPVVLAAAAFAWRPELYVDSGVRPKVCDQVGDVPVCLHRAYAKSLGVTTHTVASLQAAGAEPLLRSVTDLALVDLTAIADGDAVVSLDLSRPSPEQVVQTVPEQVAFQVSGALLPGTCGSSREENRSFDLANLVRRRILMDAGFSALVKRLDQAVGGVRAGVGAERAIAAMSARRFVEFVAAHRETITSCDLSIDHITRS